MKYYTMRAELLSAERRNCSVNGNPAYTLGLYYENEVIYCKTASDSQCAYGMSNYKIGDLITVKGHYTRAGNFIIDYIKD